MNLVDKVYAFLKSEWNDLKIDRRRRSRYRLSRKRELLLADMKREADRRAYNTGKKHWIVEDYDGSLVILNREGIKVFIRHGKLSKKVTTTDFDREAIYTTQITTNKYMKKGDPPRDQHVKESVVHRFLRNVIGV